MHGRKILLVEDDSDIVDLITFVLSRDGFALRCATTGEEALSLLENDKPDLVLLDLMLPGIGGLEVARRLKSHAEWKKIPIVMVTARSEEMDVLKGFDAGADDYVTKPFSPRVLAARVRAVLKAGREAHRKKGGPILVHDLSIHPGHRQAILAGTPLDLSFTEFEILRCLAERPGWVFTRAQIIDAVRGEGYSVSDRSVDAQVFALRKKLKGRKEYIETVRGVGYRLKRADGLDGGSSDAEEW